ncbi:MAG: Ig-like domain-containing protein [Prevotella sp.]|nr:Ig-like domain-containing protein [Prevotella sp.]
MIKNISRYVLALLMMVVAMPSFAAFKDFKIDLTAYNDASSLLTAEEVSSNANFEFGIAVADDGTVSRVGTTDASAVAVISGQYHNDHGCTGVKLVVPVDGAVKIGVGNCTYSGHTVKVTDGSGAEVASFAVGTGCWSRNKSDDVVTFGYYRGGATTLTIESKSYTPYMMVAAASDIPTEYTATFSWGDAAQEGSLPANIKVNEGESIKIPVNFTLFQEGKTLTGWTDGKNTYAIGEEVKMVSDLTLTPVFTANTVSLADRTEPVTIKWDFQQKNGAPAVAYQNKTGFWVAQAVVNGKTIDVKTDFDTNNGGKFANGNWQDWAQLNGGTKFTIPSCKGAIVNVEAYNALGTGDNPLKIDGQSDYVSDKTISYEIANTAETIDVVIGSEGSYYRYIQVVLPVVQSTGGKTYNNEAANIVWDLNDVDLYATPNVLTPEGAFTLCTVSTGDFTVGVDAPNAGANNGVKMLKLQPNGDNRSVEFIAKPCKGLTFTATKVSAKVARFGTDGGLLTVTVKNAEGEEAVLASGLIPARNNKEQADDKHGAEEKYTTEFTLDVPASLATSESFTLVITEEGSLGATKQIGIGDVHIEGTVNGTTEAVAKYTISAKANPENGGSVNVYPNGNEFDAGTELKLTATEKFGFDFVNWTDATGAVLSEEAVYVHTLNDNVELTANFKQVNTYELAITLDGGANDYMVQLAPAPTIVDGKTMYEEGTEVALTAASNAILTFNSWSDGQTSSEIKVNMTENIALTANYSAIDYIVGWDFYRRGNNGRVADFYSTADNEAAQLILTNESGSITGWLDKSTEAANGYESMKGAAVNWQKIGDKYYYQTKINASEFTNIKVQAQMLYNYIAHKTQKIEYSVDGTNWTEAGRATMPAAKTVTDIEATLGEDANNASELYIRFIPDYTSDRDGSGDGDASNDGTSITNIFVTGTMKLVDDGKAPALVSTVPATGAANASANGRVVMTFDEKIKLTAAAKATLNGEELALSASGKAVTAEYKNLSYATEYTFQLAAGSVSDLTDNVLNEAVNVTFTTMTKPTVNKALYDFIVPDDGNFKEALAAAGSRADKSKRFRIFVKQGNHIIPANENSMVTGSDGKSYPDPKTSFGAPNTSIIGEDMALTTVANTMPNDLASNPDAGAGGQANPLEGIRTSGLLYMTSGATNTYFQDITLKTNTPDATGRNVILVDGGNKTICKDVTLWAYQDTYVSDREQSLYYFEGGVIRGRTDFICGSGDVFFNDVDIVMCEQGGYIVAPRANVKYGYVFKDCTLKGEQDNVNGNYFLGRPWTEAAETYYIDCTMEAIPTAAGWTNMSAGGCTRFAEYNSVSASGTTVDLSGRVKELGKENPHSFNPVLSAEEAAEIGNMSNMFGDWDPRQATEQAPTPTNVKLYQNDKTMVWDNSDYALLWAVCKDGKAVAFVTEPTYVVDDVNAKWSVRAANEMGGLGDAAEATLTVGTGIESINNAEGVVSTSYYNLNGVKVGKNFKGTVIKVETLNNGQQITSKIIK